MKENFDECLALLIAPDREGGFVNHPKDPGGMTNMGVTKQAWEEWVGRSSTEKEMRSLKPANIYSFYKRKYWDKVNGDLLPAKVDYAVFDFAVNSGPGRAAKVLQRILGVKQDGDIGPVTLEKAASVDSKKLVEDYNAERLLFLKSLPTWPDFGNGWERRVSEVTNEALTMTT